MKVQSSNTINKSSILYLGTVIPEDSLLKSFSNDFNPQMATHLFSKKLFKAFTLFSKEQMVVLSTRPISDYPRNKILINFSKFWIINNVNVLELFFVNLPVLKTLSLFVSTFFYSFCWGFKINRKYSNIIFIDNYQLPYLLSGYFIKFFFKVPVVCVITDPPNMTYKNLEEPYIKKIFRKMNLKLTLFLYHRLDGSICMTKFIADKFTPNSQSLIIEAIGQGNIFPNVRRSDKFSIIYSGGLSTKYGIIELIRAFNSLPFEDIELLFYGRGDAENLIKEWSMVDNRISYNGFIGNEEMLEIQASSSLLVNPRPTNLPDSLYSFPSKILEYLESGTPSLVTKLPGIPEEYFEYLFVVYDNKYSESLRHAYNFFKSDYISYSKFGENAKVFSYSKNLQSQSEKIKLFLNEVKKKYYGY